MRTAYHPSRPSASTASFNNGERGASFRPAVQTVRGLTAAARPLTPPRRAGGLSPPIIPVSANSPPPVSRADTGAQGFTLVELIVAMGVLTLLTAIIVPAVVSSRNASRKLTCENNLKQILTAFHHFEQSYRYFPGPHSLQEGRWGWSEDILPFLEQPKPVHDVKTGRVTGGPEWVEVYACPADPWVAPQEYDSRDRNSYLPNHGHGNHRNDGFFRRDLFHPVRASDVTDGLSNTAALSEKLVVPGAIASMDKMPDDDAFWGNRRVRRTKSFLPDLDLFADECEDRSDPHLIEVISLVAYNHVQTPNRRSCTNGPRSSQNAFDYMAVTATSLHTGGVNVGYGDGAVRFVSEAVDRKVWRAIGTRNGGD